MELYVIFAEYYDIVCSFKIAITKDSSIEDMDSEGIKKDD